MKTQNLIFILTSLAFLTLLNCKSSDKETSNAQDSVKTVQPPKEYEKKEYETLKNLFKKESYTGADYIIGSLNKESIYFDSMKAIKSIITEKRHAYEKKRDVLSKSSMSDYFNDLHLPYLDSITDSNADITNHSYRLDFIPFDKQLFKTGDSGNNWYLSQQHKSGVICLTVCYQSDCEGSIMLYSLDHEYNIIDKVELNENGCFLEPANDFRYEQYIINQKKYFNGAYFLNDSTFIKINRTSFSLKDSLTNEVKIEIGDEVKTTYLIEKTGKFKELATKKIKKNYVKPFYDAPI